METRMDRVREIMRMKAVVRKQQADLEIAISDAKNDRDQAICEEEDRIQKEVRDAKNYDTGLHYCATEARLTDRVKCLQCKIMRLAHTHYRLWQEVNDLHDECCLLAHESNEDMLAILQRQDARDRGVTR